jgi:hypothetical protein
LGTPPRTRAVARRQGGEGATCRRSCDAARPHSPWPRPPARPAAHSSFNALASGSLSPYAPVCVAALDPRIPHRVAFARWAQGGGRSLAAPGRGAGRGAHGQQPPADWRAPLPDHLTPEHVAALLRELRAAARRRGLFRSPADPDGEHLVVPVDRASPGDAEGVAAGGGAAAPGHDSAAKEGSRTHGGAVLGVAGGTNRRRYGSGLGRAADSAARPAANGASRTRAPARPRGAAPAVVPVGALLGAVEAPAQQEAREAPQAPLKAPWEPPSGGTPSAAVEAV